MKKNKDPRIAIIILNWNGFNDTVECLESFKKINYNNYRIVLVDNGSDNNEGRRLKETFPQIHLIQNKQNRGFAGGNNDAINWALENGFEYIVTLNNDCIVGRGWLSNLVNGLKVANGDFGSSRIMFYPDIDLICSDGDVLLLDGSAIAVNRCEAYSGSDKIKSIFCACAAGAIFSRKCLQNVRIKKNQFFDELYFAFYEDVDLGIRLNSKSYKGVSIPNAVVYHKHSKTAGEYSKFKVFQSEKNRILNEFLNYPICMIYLGELFFFFKIFLLTVYPIFYKKSKGHRYLKNLGIFHILLLFIKARFWIMANFFLVLKDRQERKSKGFIKNKLYKYFYFNFSKILK